MRGPSLCAIAARVGSVDSPSACQSGSDKGSHVLNAFLSEEDLKKPSLRFSFSIFNTRDEIDYVVGVLKEFFEK